MVHAQPYPFLSVTRCDWGSMGAGEGMRTSPLWAAAPMRRVLRNAGFRTGCHPGFLPGSGWVGKVLGHCLPVTKPFSLKPSSQQCRLICYLGWKQSLGKGCFVVYSSLFDMPIGLTVQSLEKYIKGGFLICKFAIIEYIVRRQVFCFVY